MSQDNPFANPSSQSSASAPSKWDAVPENGILPKGYYRVRIQQLSVTGNGLQDAPDQKVAWLARMEIVAPESEKGMIHFERFFLGTNEDPKAELPSTLRASFGARNLKTFLNRARVPMGNDDEATCAKAAGAELIVFLSEGMMKDGSPINNCRGFYELGSPEEGKVGMALPGAASPGAPVPPPLATFQGGGSAAPWAKS